MADNELPKISVPISAGIANLKSELMQGDAMIKAFAESTTRTISSRWDASGKSISRSIRSTASEVEQQAKTQLNSFARYEAEQTRLHSKSLADRKKADEAYVKFWERELQKLDKAAAKPVRPPPTIGRGTASATRAAKAEEEFVPQFTSRQLIERQRKVNAEAERDRRARAKASGQLSTKEVESEIKAHEKLESELSAFKAREADNRYKSAQREASQATKVRQQSQALALREEKQLASAKAAIARESKSNQVGFRGPNVPFLKFGSGDEAQQAKKFAGATMIAATGVIALTGALFLVTKAYADYGSELYRGSQRTGVSVKELSGLRVGVEELGGNFKQLVTGLTFLDKQIDANASKVTKQANAFQRMGVDVKDATGKVLPTGQILLGIADKFSTMADGAAKTSLASKLFGRQAGPELVPFLNLGANGIQLLIDKAHNLGLEFDENSARAAMNLKKNFKELEQATTGLKLQLGAALLPVVLRLTQEMTPLVGQVTKYVKDSPEAVNNTAQWAMQLGVMATAALAARTAMSLLGVAAGGLPALLIGVAAATAYIAFQVREVDAAMHGLTDATTVTGKGKNTIVTTSAGSRKLKNPEDEARLRALVQERRELKVMKAGNIDGMVHMEPGDYTINDGPNAGIYDKSGKKKDPTQLRARVSDRLAPDFAKRAHDAPVHIDQAINEVTKRMDSLTEDIGDTSTGDVVPPAGGGAKAKVNPNAGKKELRAAQLRYQFSLADLELARTKQTLEAENKEYKAKLDERSISFQEYYDKVSANSKAIAKAEKVRINKDILSAEGRGAELRGEVKHAKTPGERRSLEGEQFDNEARINELKGKREVIDAQLRETQAGLNRDQVKANNEYDDFLKSLQREYKGISNDDERFNEQRLQAQDDYEKKVDRFKAEMSKRAPKVDTEAGATDAVAIGTAELAIIGQIRDLKLATIKVDESSARLGRAQNALSLREKSIQNSILLGTMSELQGKDALLVAQRATLPEMKKMLDAQTALVKAKGSDATAEEIAKLEELRMEFQLIGKDMDKVAQEGRILHQMDIVPAHLNDGVREFLSNVKSMQQILTDLRTNAVKTGFDLIDSSIDRMTKRLGFAKDLVGGFMKELAHLGTARLLEKLFGFKINKPATQVEVTKDNTSAVTTLSEKVVTLTDAINNAMQGASSNSATSVQSVAGGIHETAQAADALGGVTNNGGPATASGGGGFSQIANAASGVATSAGLSGTGSSSGQSTLGGKAASAGINVGAKIATSPAATKWFGSLFGLGGKKAGGGGGVQQYDPDTGDPSGMSGGAASGAKELGKTAGINGASMGAGFLQSMTNSGGTSGAIEDQVFQAGASMGFTPVGIGLMAGAIGAGLLIKLLGGGDIKALKSAISAKWGINIKGDKVGDKLLQDIKSTEEQAYGAGTLKSHIQDSLAIPSIKDMVEGYAEQTGQFNNILVRTKQGTDPNATANDVQRVAGQIPGMAEGGHASSGRPVIVGDRHGLSHAEVFVPHTSGTVLPSAEQFLGAGAQNMRYSNFVSGMNGGPGSPNDAMMHSLMNAHYETMSKVEEHLGRLRFATPGSIAQMGSRENPEAFSYGANEGYRSNDAHRREFNKMNRT